MDLFGGQWLRDFSIEAIRKIFFCVHPKGLLPGSTDSSYKKRCLFDHSYGACPMNAKRLFCLSHVFAAAALLVATGAHAQSDVPDSIKVPAGNKVSMETVGVGEITYECRDKPNAAGQTEWTFVGPKAVLNDRSGKQVGTYYGPPATWEAKDGSKVTGTQLAVAPSSAGNLPYQLVKANPAEGKGAMVGVSYIQRVALKGGVAPATACTTAQKGQKETVKYQADYIFWAAE
jgi:hypothetical protein